MLAASTACSPVRLHFCLFPAQPPKREAARAAPHVHAAVLTLLCDRSGLPPPPPCPRQAEIKRRRLEQRGGGKLNKKAVRMPGKDASSFD